MTAATRSRLECSASERIPRLPVTTARNTFSAYEHHGRTHRVERLRQPLFATGLLSGLRIHSCDYTLAPHATNVDASAIASGTREVESQFGCPKFPWAIYGLRTVE